MTNVNDMIKGLNINNKELDLFLENRREIMSYARKDYCRDCSHRCKHELPIRKNSKILIINGFDNEYKTYELIAKLSLAFKKDYNSFSYMSLMKGGAEDLESLFDCSFLSLVNEISILKPELIIGIGSLTTKTIQRVLKNNYKINKSEEVIINPTELNIPDYSFRYIETVSLSALEKNFENKRNILAGDLYKVLNCERLIA